MKRIIQCPKCEAKLSVFDIGKPISQKCPKCGNSINVESEEPTADENKEDKAVDATVLSKAPENSQPNGKTVKAKDEKTFENKDSDACVRLSDKPQIKKTPSSPVATPALDVLPTPEPPRNGGLFKAFVVGALLIIIAMQMITKLNSDKQYKTLIEHLQFIERKLGN
ncbi:MAG: hypothetical protein PHU80_07540 [Kiritimatiellae bacterium]|nr:hypothetical protein [Kiritimatiellia bacterium]